MKTRLLRVLVAAVTLAGAAALAMVLRSAFLEADEVPQGEAYPFEFDESGAPGRLALALQLATVGTEEPALADSGAWLSLHRHLEEAFPLVHRVLKAKTVSDLSLLYRWPGSEPGLDPILLTAHMDVVAATPDTTGPWQYDPFSGAIARGYIWGRGTIDAKGPMVGMLEAVEGLLAAGFSPRRTVLFAFGHDGEAEGEGARQIVDLLSASETRLSWVLGEGLYLVSDLIPGLRDPVGIVGVAEKGTMNVRLVARAAGSSGPLPPRHSALGLLSRALVRIEDQAFEPEIRGPALELLDILGPLMDPGTRLLVANLWLLEGPLASALTESPILNTSLRTTISPTSIELTPGDATLPSEATVFLQTGIAPWDNEESVLDRIRDLVSDSEIEVEAVGTATRAAAALDWEAPKGVGFHVLKEAIHRSFPDVVAVVPALAPHPTDARHFSAITDHVYGFTPFRIGEGNLATIHGKGERVRVSAYLDVVRFYAELIQRGAE